MNLQSHGAQAVALSKAANLAAAIGKNLTDINAGHSDAGMRAVQVNKWFVELAGLLGYTIAKESK